MNFRTLLYWTFEPWFRNTLPIKLKFWLFFRRRGSQKWLEIQMVVRLYPFLSIEISTYTIRRKIHKIRNVLHLSSFSRIFHFLIQNQIPGTWTKISWAWMGATFFGAHEMFGTRNAQNFWTYHSAWRGKYHAVWRVVLEGTNKFKK